MQNQCVGCEIFLVWQCFVLHMWPSPWPWLKVLSHIHSCCLFFATAGQNLQNYMKSSNHASFYCVSLINYQDQILLFNDFGQVCVALYHWEARCLERARFVRNIVCNLS